MRVPHIPPGLPQPHASPAHPQAHTVRQCEGADGGAGRSITAANPGAQQPRGAATPTRELGGAVGAHTPLSLRRPGIDRAAGDAWRPLVPPDPLPHRLRRAHGAAGEPRGAFCAVHAEPERLPPPRGAAGGDLWTTQTRAAEFVLVLLSGGAAPGVVAWGPTPPAAVLQHVPGGGSRAGAVLAVLAVRCSWLSTIAWLGQFSSVTLCHVCPCFLH